MQGDDQALARDALTSTALQPNSPPNHDTWSQRHSSLPCSTAAPSRAVPGFLGQPSVDHLAGLCHRVFHCVGCRPECAWICPFGVSGAAVHLSTSASPRCRSRCRPEPIAMRRLLCRDSVNELDSPRASMYVRLRTDFESATRQRELRAGH